MTTKPTRKPTVKFETDKRNARRGTLTVGGFRVVVEPDSDALASLAFSGTGPSAELGRLGAELRNASVRWVNGDIFEALSSPDHEPGMADGDVLARVGCVGDDVGRVLVTLAMAHDPCCTEADVEIASLPDGRYTLASESEGFEPAQMGAIGSILETIGRNGALGDLLESVCAAARDCGCEDLDDALAEDGDA